MLLTFLLVYIKNKQSWMLTKVVRIDFNHNNYCNREEESPAWTKLNFTKTGVQRFFFKIGSARGKAPAAAAAAKSLQSCPTLCNPRDSSPPGSPVPRILQAGILDWVAISFSNACMKVKSESEVTQSCPTLSDPMDCSPPGSSVHGILQGRVLEWGAIAFGHSKNLGRWVNPEGTMQWESPRPVAPCENIYPPVVQYGCTEFCFVFFSWTYLCNLFPPRNFYHKISHFYLKETLQIVCRVKFHDLTLMKVICMLYIEIHKVSWLHDNKWSVYLRHVFDFLNFPLNLILFWFHVANIKICSSTFSVLPVF